MSTEIVTDERMLSGNVTHNFFRFAIPSIVGLLAVSSAGVVDGMFVGNYVGSTALAAVNLVTPLYSLFFGICVMVMVGGVVGAGKSFGAGDLRQSCNIFTKSVIIVMVYAIVITATVMIFAEDVALMLGARDELLPLTRDYIQIVAAFLFFMGLSYGLSYFSRVDDAPNFSLFGLIATAILNILLDVLFIAVLEWGIAGAAYATGLAYVGGSLIFVARLFSHHARIRLIMPYGSWWEMLRAAYNGLSEFINEISGGLIVFVINWILVSEIGAIGVAGFTIINYSFWISLMIGYGIAEALGPLVSVNFGAGQSDRIRQFVRLAVGTAIATGILISAGLLIYPDVIVTAFITADETETIALTLAMIALLWPTFLMNGVNIAFSGYFTGMHAATNSAIIAISRSLILPMILFVTFWQMLGMPLAFVAFPIAEALTLLLCLWLYYRAQPDKLVAKDQASKFDVSAG